MATPLMIKSVSCDGKFIILKLRPKYLSEPKSSEEKIIVIGLNFEKSAMRIPINPIFSNVGKRLILLLMLNIYKLPPIPVTKALIKWV